MQLPSLKMEQWTAAGIVLESAWVYEENAAVLAIVGKPSNQQKLLSHALTISH